MDLASKPGQISFRPVEIPKPTLDGAALYKSSLGVFLEYAKKQKLNLLWHIHAPTQFCL